jgi:hypothetical protein
VYKNNKTQVHEKYVFLYIFYINAGAATALAICMSRPCSRAAAAWQTGFTNKTGTTNHQVFHCTDRLLGSVGDIRVRWPW